MKRYAAMILTVAILLCGTAYASSNGVTRADAVRAITDRIYDGFALEDHYAVGDGRLRFVDGGDAAAYPALCLLYDDVPDAGFTDVVDGDDAYIHVMLARALGFVRGYGDATFRPARALTYAEAARMLVGAIRYDYMTEKHGAYPEGYIGVLDELSISDGMAYAANDVVSAADFALLLARTFEQEGPMNILMRTFVPPTAPDECAERYADAVRRRDGVTQYLLLSDALRADLRADFEALWWVTGVSSPWVEDYTCEDTGGGTYAIVFAYATSTGPEYEQTVTLTIDPDTCRIVDLAYADASPY